MSGIKIAKDNLCFDFAVKTVKEELHQEISKCGAKLCCPSKEEKDDDFSLDTFFKKEIQIARKPKGKSRAKNLGEVKVLCWLKAGKTKSPKKRYLLNEDNGP